MKLLIKQRVFSFVDSYQVFDESGNVRYEVEDALFRLGHNIHVYDKNTGREVGSIHQKLFTFLPEFEIVIDGRVMGSVRKEFTFFHPKYHVDYRGWSVEGDVFGWDYRVMRGDMEVMSISKELFNWSDTYSLRYDSPADEIPGLLLVIAIDAVNCDRNKN
jgi:uncharacterized protein YxjI